MTDRIRKLSALWGGTAATLVLAMFLHAPASAQELTPNGIGSYSEFNVPMYAFRLDLEFLSTDDEEILENEEPKRLNVRILAPTVTARQWSKFWIQNVSINTSASELSQRADELIAITQVLRGSLQSGDLVVIDRPSPDRLELSVNDVSLYQSEAADLFEVLLSALLGPVPPTTELKEALLAGGTLAASDWELFDSMQPAAERVATIRGWLPDAEPAAGEPVQVAGSGAPEQPDQIASASPDGTPGEGATAADSTPVQVAEVENAVDASTDPASLAEAQDAEAVAAQGGESTVAADDGEQLPALTAEALLEAQSYTQQVVSAIYRNIRYPARELELQRTGSTRVVVRINRDGTLHSSEVAVAARYRAFDRATTDAIEKTFPVEPVPGAIDDDPYEFILPVTFQLGR